MKSLDIEQGKNEDTDELLPKASTAKAVEAAAEFDIFAFLLAFAGLQCSYLTWGIMQELIMNTHFNATPMTPDGMFPSATFCVFSNRALAIVVAAMMCMWRSGTLSSEVPWLSFTPCALSNTISSWAQYESLSYVSFPLQNLFKSTKIIPVMVMGKVLNKVEYSIVEYGEAVAISLGVLMFTMGKNSHAGSHRDTSAWGLLLLCTYIIADSFTSQYQSSIYKKHGKIDQYHMMFGVNLSAICLTFGSLLLSGEFPVIIEFFQYNPTALMYNVITAVCSAVGQFFIYYTIRKFGPIVFTIIMTTRQMISMMLSMIFFGHTITIVSGIGTVCVFASVFHSINRSMNKNKK